MAPSIQTVTLTSGGNGVSLVSGSNYNSQNPIWVLNSLTAGSGITITGDPTVGNVTITATGLPPLISLVTADAHWVSIEPNQLPIFIAAYPVIVTAILGRVEIASSTTPASVMVVKVPSGVAITDGTALATAGVDATATPYAVQTLSLTQDISVLTLDVGDSIAIQPSGTWTNASGSLTVHMAPVLQGNA